MRDYQVTIASVDGRDVAYLDRDPASRVTESIASIDACRHSAGRGRVTTYRRGRLTPNSSRPVRSVAGRTGRLASICT